MIDDIRSLTTRLEKLMAMHLSSAGGVEPPRLVRANSAFDLYKALKRIEQNPELEKFLARSP